MSQLLDIITFTYMEYSYLSDSDVYENGQLAFADLELECLSSLKTIGPRRVGCKQGVFGVFWSRAYGLGCVTYQ